MKPIYDDYKKKFPDLFKNKDKRMTWLAFWKGYEKDVKKKANGELEFQKEKNAMREKYLKISKGKWYVTAADIYKSILAWIR